MHCSFFHSLEYKLEEEEQSIRASLVLCNVKEGHHCANCPRRFWPGPGDCINILMSKTLKSEEKYCWSTPLVFHWNNTAFFRILSCKKALHLDQNTHPPTTMYLLIKTVDYHFFPNIGYAEVIEIAKITGWFTAGVFSDSEYPSGCVKRYAVSSGEIDSTAKNRSRRHNEQ